MKNIMIFAGTTEGKLLSKWLCDLYIKHYVCVASNYGMDVMQESEYALVHIGRLDVNQMIDYMKECGVGSEESVVIDCTHPYAVEVTENIIAATDSLNAEYIRVIRKASDDSGDAINCHDDIKACAEYLKNTTGNILVTTGSKELKDFANVIGPDNTDRVYVRVLPSLESIALCSDAGIRLKNIIAMHGPFTASLNKAIYEQYNIKHLVTKQSGNVGGFEEKITPAVELNIACHVIVRPIKEDGYDVREVFKLITQNEKIHRHIYVNLIGVGMGTKNLLTIEAKEAIDNADIIYGAKRLVENIKHDNVHQMYMPEEIIPSIKEYVRDRLDDIRIAILYSGDSSFYSGAKKMNMALVEYADSDDVSLEISIIPGISSISYLASKVGVSYEDASILSVHGRTDAVSFDLVKNSVIYNEKTFVLVSSIDDIKRIINDLNEQNINARIIIGSNFSYDNEEIIESDVLQLSEYYEREMYSYVNYTLSTILIINSNARSRKLIPVFEDSDFIRDKVPMTKSCIRHESIIKLGLCKGDVVYDIGAGTGSVAIEIAGLDLSLKVYAIERKIEAVNLLKNNIKKHGLHNVEAIPGYAPNSLQGLEPPNAVFIGGSAGRIDEILDYIHKLGNNIRVVITAVSMETIANVNGYIAANQPENVQIVQLAMTEVRNVGSHHMMQANNPVFIFSFEL